jgi:signal transduction histidine kinase
MNKLTLKWRPPHILGLISVIALLACLSTVNFLLFHTIVELACVIVTFTLAVLAYNTYDISNSSFFTILGLSYGFIGFFDFFHTLFYKGMTIIPNISADLSIQLWIITRFLDSLSLLIALLCLGRNIKNIKVIVLTGYSIISICLMLALFNGNILPKCYIDGQGLTSFKIAAEYTIIGIFGLNIMITKKKAMLLPRPITTFLLQYAILTILSEACFTLYSDVYGYMNAAGHLFKLASYVLLFHLLLRYALKHPHEVLTAEFNLASQEIEIKAIQLELQEKKRLTMEEKISQLDKLHLVGEMAASIGHEIRNPLTTVRGYLQFFSQKTEFSQHQNAFDLIISELDRANHIITEFLSLAKDRKLTLQNTNLNTIIQDILPVVEASALLKGCSIEVELDKPANIMLDAKLIHQLLLNLVQNGLEAMNSGGNLKMSTINMDGMVLLSVKDDGPGIPEHILEKLGTPFLTTKPTGTGLGLPICFNIADKHHASIEVKSTPSGTEFITYFRIN